MKKSHISFLLMGTVLVTGCDPMTRLSEVGRAPAMTQIRNPQGNPNIYPVSMPIPQPRKAFKGQNTLWQTGARAFFRDQRARQIGDLLTIDVNFSDTADISNSTERKRNTTQKVSLNSFIAGPARLAEILPEGVDPTDLFGASSTPTHKGDGKIKRSEKLAFKLAAVVTQVLPNGNLVVSGRQEIRVNHELRELMLTGIIRPQDIDSSNTIESTKIAEARISYGGRGQVSDVQRAPWGHQIIDAITPF